MWEVLMYCPLHKPLRGLLNNSSMQVKTKVTVLGYTILISTGFLRFYFSVFSLVSVSIERLYQTLERAFGHISQPLGVWKCTQTRYFVFDIFHIFCPILFSWPYLQNFTYLNFIELCKNGKTCEVSWVTTSVCLVDLQGPHTIGRPSTAMTFSKPTLRLSLRSSLRNYNHS